MNEGTAELVEFSPLPPKADMNMLNYDKNIRFLECEYPSVSQSDIREYNDTFNDIHNQTLS